MADTNITKIPAPRTPLLDQNSGDMTPAWYRFFYNIFITLGEGSGILPTTRGGTGQSIYTNGQLLIGNSVTGSLNKNTLTPLAGIQVVNGPGTITIENTGVTSVTAGPGIDIDVGVGDIVVSNTGVLSFSGGSTGLTPTIATAGDVTLAGTLDVNNGGTGQISYTNGQLLIGNSAGNTLAKSTLTAGSGVAITNGAGSITIATNGTVVTSAPVTKTADFTVGATDTWIINNKSGSTCVVTLPSPSTNTGRVLYFQNYQAQLLNSATSNVVPRAGGAAGTAILSNTAGDTTTLVSDGTNWIAMQYTPNNVLLI